MSYFEFYNVQKQCLCVAIEVRKHATKNSVFSLVFRAAGKTVFQTGKAALRKVLFYHGVQSSALDLHEKPQKRSTLGLVLQRPS